MTGLLLTHDLRVQLRLQARDGKAGDVRVAAVEFLLHALAGCVTTTFVLHAMARGITNREPSTELEGDLDLQGLLGLDDSVSPGYEQIRVRMHVMFATMTSLRWRQ